MRIKDFFKRNDHLDHHIVDWKTAYQVEKLMGAAVEFRECSQNFTAVLPVFSSNSSYKTLAVSVMEKLIRHEIPC
jgi:hypothetical protein